MRKGDNIRLRSDGRYEARYIKSRDETGKILYGYCYGKTIEEAKEKRDYQIDKMKKPRQLNLLILGAGIHGRDVYEIAKSTHVFSNISFLDDNKKNDKIIGDWSEIEKYLDRYPTAIVAVGDEETRKIWTEKIEKLGFIVPTLVHPTAYLPEDIEIGNGTVICARATLSAGVKIGKGCIISSGAIVPRKLDIPSWSYFDIDRIIHYRNNENER